MRTTVVIDDELMTKALQITGLKTKAAVIDLALRTLTQQECLGRVDRSTDRYRPALDTLAKE